MLYIFVARMRRSRKGERVFPAEVTHSSTFSSLHLRRRGIFAVPIVWAKVCPRGSARIERAVSSTRRGARQVRRATSAQRWSKVSGRGYRESGAQRPAAAAPDALSRSGDMPSGAELCHLLADQSCAAARGCLPSMCAPTPERFGGLASGRCRRVARAKARGRYLARLPCPGCSCSQLFLALSRGFCWHWSLCRGHTKNGNERGVGGRWRFKRVPP